MTKPPAMPELPEPVANVSVSNPTSGIGFAKPDKPYYTADQMRARDAMWAERLAALQSAQPAAVVSDEGIEEIARGKSNHVEFARAILALRPQAVPIGFVNKPVVWEPHQSEMVVKITCKAQPTYGFTHAVYAGPLRPQAVPMTEDQVWHSDGIMSANGIAGFKFDALMRIVRAVEAHHGITAQAKEGGA